MDGQGVEEFVGEDAVGRSRERRGVKGEYVGGHAVGIGERGFVPGGLYWVNDGVADGVGEIVGQVARCSEYVAAEEAVASAGLDNREGVGAFQQGPEVEELDGEEGAEGGMDSGTGVVVGACGWAGVVAARGVEGGGHEIGKGDGAVASDAAADGAFRRRGRQVSRRWCGGHSAVAGSGGWGRRGSRWGYFAEL